MRPFWSNRVYSDYQPQLFDATSLTTAGQLEHITAFFTFIHRCDHFAARPIYFADVLDAVDYDESLDSKNPAFDSAWHNVIMSGLFEIALDKLAAERDTLKIHLVKEANDL